MSHAAILVLVGSLAASGSTGCSALRPNVRVRPAPVRLNIDSLAARAPRPGPIRLGDPVPAAELRIPPRVARALAARPNLRLRRSAGSSPMRLVVSIADRKLSMLEGRDTLFQTPIAVASGLRLTYAGHAWNFHTPRGERHVLRKVAHPVWTPPDWHYAEAAIDHGLRLARLPAGGAKLSRGRRLVIQNGVVGLIPPGDHFRVLPTDEHVVFDGQLFIPPYGTQNRRVSGELGDFALDLGEGYMIHGASDASSIGQATTHGCIRVGEEDLIWLFENVPVGTAVMIQ